MGAARRSARGAREGQAPLRAQGLQAARQVDAGEDQEGREGLAPHQGARRLGQQGPARAAARVGAVAGSPWRSSSEGADRGGADPRASCSKLGAPRRAVEAKAVAARCWRRPPTGRSPGTDWLFEPKLDGYRVLAVRAGGDGEAPHPERQRLQRRVSRGRARGRGAAVRPRCCSTARSWRSTTRGVPSFQRLQGRARLRRADRHPARGGRDARSPTTRFDLLGFEDFDLAAAAAHRPARRCSSGCCRRSARSATSSTSRTTARRSTSEAERLGLEGVVGQEGRPRPTRRDARPHWLKIRARRSGDFVVVGFTAPKGSRGGFGALHLAEYVDGALTYAGRAGSGFTDKQLGEVRRTLRGAAPRHDPPCVGPVPAEKGTDVGRAHAGVPRSSTPSGRRRPAAPAGVPAVPRRQAAGGVHRERRRSGSRRSEAPPAEAERRPPRDGRRTRPPSRDAAATSSRSSSPTSRRSSGPRTATPRAT